jgi:hypothetical protein
VNYFNNLFATTNPSLQWELESFFTAIIVVEGNKVICAITTDAGIYQTIRQLNPTKELRPDRMTGHFDQEYKKLELNDHSMNLIGKNTHE